MTQAANNYGQVLYELKVPKEMVEEAEVLFREVPQLKEALVSPVVKKSEKNRVIDRVFPAELRNFLKLLCVRLRHVIQRRSQTAFLFACIGMVRLEDVFD